MTISALIMFVGALFAALLAVWIPFFWFAALQLLILALYEVSRAPRHAEEHHTIADYTPDLIDIWDRTDIWPYIDIWPYYRDPPYYIDLGLDVRDYTSADY